MNAFELARMIQEAMTDDGPFDDIGLDEVRVAAGSEQSAALRITLLNGQRFQMVLTEIHG